MSGRFVRSITVCLDQIWGYRQLSAELEHLRRTPYDSDQPEHEQKLHQLWSLLCPEVSDTGIQTCASAAVNRCYC